jgi:molybdate transport system substrate-binding protein
VRRHIGAGRLVALAAFAATIGGAAAAELHVLSTAAVKGPLADVAAEFERATGQRVVIEYATAGGVDARLDAGARPDLVVNSAPRIAARARAAGDAARARALGTVRIGVAVRAGAPRPDLSTVDTLRAALVAAESIAYGDPARGATTGVHFAQVVARLGIADAIAGKRRLAADGLDVMKMVTHGEAELGITQQSEIVHVDATTFAGLLPEAVQLATTYAAWVPAGAHSAAQALADALTAAPARERFRAEGFAER